LTLLKFVLGGVIHGSRVRVMGFGSWVVGMIPSDNINKQKTNQSLRGL